MSKEDTIKFEGTVVMVLPNNMFRVRLTPNEVEIIAYLNGKMRQNKIRVTEGDRVDCELTPYDLTKGRITFRHK
jgi:translation initiation factor IF-1